MTRSDAVRASLAFFAAFVVACGGDGQTDVGDTVASCTPPRACEPEVTCVAGFSYPTTCGPDNCDPPIGPCAPDCDARLPCGGGPVCVHGLLYPTACGPYNCDAPIGGCGPDCDPNFECVREPTCIDHLEYPTDCGPANCDEPLGPCPGWDGTRFTIAKTAGIGRTAR